MGQNDPHGTSSVKEFEKDLAVDEEMAQYLGWHSAKMFFCRKPIKFDFKNIVFFALSDGYFYKFETHIEANGAREPQIVFAFCPL